MAAVASWGRLGAGEHEVQSLSDRQRVADQISGKTNSQLALAYGMGRSYGDVCLIPAVPFG